MILIVDIHEKKASYIEMHFQLLDNVRILEWRLVIEWFYHFWNNYYI